VAMGLFVRSVEEWRNMLRPVLKAATEDAKGAHVQYADGLSALQLSAVSPYLTPAAIKQLYSQTYNLPPEFFRDDIEMSAGGGKPPEPSKTEYVSEATR